MQFHNHFFVLLFAFLHSVCLSIVDFPLRKHHLAKGTWSQQWPTSSSSTAAAPVSTTVQNGHGWCFIHERAHVDRPYLSTSSFSLESSLDWLQNPKWQCSGFFLTEQERKREQGPSSMRKIEARFNISFLLESRIRRIKRSRKCINLQHFFIVFFFLCFQIAYWCSKPQKWRHLPCLSSTSHRETFMRSWLCAPPGTGPFTVQQKWTGGTL